MKRTDFNKEIKITSLIDGKLLGLELKSILYTPNKYRIPVAFSDRVNSADDTEKYISENYSKEDQEKLKHNEEIYNEFLAKVIELNSDDEIKKAARSLLFRVLAGVVVFLLPTIVSFIFTLVSDFANIKGSFKYCQKCVFDVRNCK